MSYVANLEVLRGFPRCLGDRCSITCWTYNLVIGGTVGLLLGLKGLGPFAYTQEFSLPVQGPSKGVWRWKLRRTQN